MLACVVGDAVLHCLCQLFRGHPVLACVVGDAVLHCLCQLFRGHPVFGLCCR